MQTRTLAKQLRPEVIQDFWRGGNAMVGEALASTQRSAQRLAARLQHHQALRSGLRLR